MADKAQPKKGENFYHYDVGNQLNIQLKPLQTKVIIRSIVAVDTVIYRKKTDIFLWKQNFRIKADLQIISS